MPAESAKKPARKTPKTYRTSRRTPPKVQNVESSQRDDAYEATTVQDRIRQWQAQGAAEALAPDAVSVRSIPASECPSSVTRPRSEHGDESSVRGDGGTREKSEGVRDKARSKSAPRRRIVSDEHWKSKEDARDKASKPTNSRRPESRRYDPSYTSNQERSKESRRSRSHQQLPTDGEIKTAIPFDDGIRVKPLDHEGPQPAEDSQSYGDVESRADDELARHLTMESMIPCDHEKYSEGSIRANDDDTSPRKSSRYAELLGRGGDAVQAMELPKARRGGLLGKTRGKIMKSETLLPVNNRIPSIEAWLDEQPDPFMDNGDREDLPPVEVPKPLRKRAHRKRTSEAKPGLADPNQIWDSISTPVEPGPPDTSKQLDSVTSPDGDRESAPRLRNRRKADQDDDDGSPSSLRRRGAKVRRRRDISTKDMMNSRDDPEAAGCLAEDPSLEEPTTASTSPPNRRCPPVGGHQPATTASPETFREPPREQRPDPPVPQESNGLRRKLTTHEDLMSVLSMPRGSRNRRSARAARRSRVKQHSSSAREVLYGLSVDEQKYARELQTLVDGVIPVLLQCALSRTNSAAAAELFLSSDSGSDEMNMTKSIVEMGIALERLKTLHKRIPLGDMDSLLSWAKTSERAYRDYLHAWRLGFEDVVVNLAPINSSTPPEQGISRDEAGDLVDGEGKKADVAYLLKRPLVRVKAFSKAFTRIRDQSDLALAVQMATTYADLTALARRRNQEEQARLEDNLAANVDATKSRDIRTMAAMTQVNVNRTRRVKARDFFNLTVYHSSGQRLDCGIELVFRDNARGDPVGGDVLVCEVDDTSKWLLFAPIELNSVSARRGEEGFDLVIMVRGLAGLGKEWHELLALKTDDKEAVTEWMNMLGSNPLPPRLNRTPDFVHPPAPLAVTAAFESRPEQADAHSQISDKATTVEQLDVPIGEPSVLGAHSKPSRGSKPSIPIVHVPSPGLSLGGGLAPKPVPQYRVPPTTITRKPVPSAVSSDRSTISDRSLRDSATILTTSSKTTSTRPGYLAGHAEKSEAFRSSQPPIIQQASEETRTQTQSANHKGVSKTLKGAHASDGWPSSPVSHHNQAPKSTAATASPQESQTLKQHSTTPSPLPTTGLEAPVQRPAYHRAVSSTPSKDLPTVNKLRIQPAHQKPSSVQTVQQSPEVQRLSPQEDQWAHQSNRGQKGSTKSKIYTEDIPPPPVHNQRQDRPVRLSLGASPSPPSTPPQRSGILLPISNNNPGLVPKPTPSPSDKTLKPRTSSPLKHEYAPSTSSGSSSDSDSDSESDTCSDTSEDVVSEHGDVPTPLVAITGADRRASKPSMPPPMPPSSYQGTGTSTGTRTLAPSDSASQGPYRRVPSSAAAPAHKKSRTIALICSWSDRGMWEQIHPDECSIVISPGLIEAFEMSAAHSVPQSRPTDDSDSRASSPGQQPLVAFELTPIVPLRRGTALDISIRSPPTPNSKIRITNNVMFRSRNPEECEALYGMINWARCNNPTYIQLQNARPARQPSVTFNVGQASHTRAKSSSWFSFGSQKKSSYRASSAPTPASVDFSVESSGTTTSAFSAFKRFSVSNAFNLNRSSVLRKEGGVGTPGSLYSSSSGTRTGSGSSTPAPSQAGFIPGHDGPNVPSTSAAAAEGGGMVNNMKIRLYVRKGQHWENLGAARLTVLPSASPPQSGQTTSRHSGVLAGASSPPATPAHSHSRSASNLTPVGQPSITRGPRLPSSSHTPHRVHGNGREKRILITRNKDRDVVLLDSVLGESCFERVMQTGVAVKVWNEDEVIAHTGGVTLGKERVYMLQFAGAREAGWVFGLVGTYRYGAGE
ncbi:hypothetical protein A1O7_02185 [Cladophialophora yegresii CBS 114405]|uniref:PI-PLC Y-box domain-containing protein n=1 Tax=Cladophialophora yegresii CBS 114405 TaxID=1182544 RepID=W9W9S2_9EURO|nr:uncharacterized protein A1O7_02185 [Cladophialophora yegresii CBS 114405]EXJ61755.1 hypothetical protein A1O7_02185 [Cladophialophora yegresii CBS 114405]